MRTPEPTSSPSTEQMMTSMEESATFVAAMSGIKAQFIGSGWSEGMAESMVFAMLMQNATGPAAS